MRHQEQSRVPLGEIIGLAIVLPIVFGLLLVLPAVLDWSVGR